MQYHSNLTQRYQRRECLRTTLSERGFYYARDTELTVAMLVHPGRTGESFTLDNTPSKLAMVLDALHQLSLVFAQPID